ncbi:Cyclopentanol dehydrogenase [Sinobacterium norvegicum]|uniref:Cyclopentanol dehydrogenase n=1 Tax=Sinobacterium norvegicum TaxID=1641715 RepID=A0ABM9AJY1_9GAMM|nr:SDR family oxidoreductase [Sinobacterium norvegicum]CAH0993069.1 Cyclopentanol dehydrogenase [Sinobacterium norvegicum]
MDRVANKVAIVTGAASGLGLAITKRLSLEGATVIMVDINEALGNTAAADIAQASFYRMDVTSEQAWQTLADQVISEHGQLDVLVNCAGIAELATIEDTTEALWRKVNAVGTDGTFFGCKHALRVMKPKGRGSIINMCSTASIMGAPLVFAYAASKSAIRGMTKSIACLSTQAGYGIRCNSVHPGNMETPMLIEMQTTFAEIDPVTAEEMSGIWVGQPDDVANMVLFLASDESKAVNGAEMVVDNATTITEGAVPMTGAAG